MLTGVHHAAPAGLACPVTFTPVLTDAFKHADEDLLAWMHGEAGSRATGRPCRVCLLTVGSHLVM